MQNPIRTGTMIAVAAASLFVAACSKNADQSTTPMSKEKAASVHCMGINSCKSQASCKSDKNACKGQNSCKGQGFLDVASEELCKGQGGSVFIQPG